MFGKSIQGVETENLNCVHRAHRPHAALHSFTKNDKKNTAAVNVLHSCSHKVVLLYGRPQRSYCFFCKDFTFLLFCNTFLHINMHILRPQWVYDPSEIQISESPSRPRLATLAHPSSAAPVDHTGRILRNQKIRVKHVEFYTNVLTHVGISGEICRSWQKHKR
jgi:hypothetical protein